MKLLITLLVVVLTARTHAGLISKEHCELGLTQLRLKCEESHPVPCSATCDKTKDCKAKCIDLFGLENNNPKGLEQCELRCDAEAYFCRQNCATTRHYCLEVLATAEKDCAQPSP